MSIRKFQITVIIDDRTKQAHGIVEVLQGEISPAEIMYHGVKNTIHAAIDMHDNQLCGCLNDALTKAVEAYAPPKVMQPIPVSKTVGHA